MARKSKTTAKPETRSVIKAGFRARYREHGGSNGDALAAQLAEFVKGGGDIRALGRANACWNDQWDSLNGGLQRMNCGNRLRALARKGEAIKWPGAKPARKRRVVSG